MPLLTAAVPLASAVITSLPPPINATLHVERDVPFGKSHSLSTSRRITGFSISGVLNIAAFVTSPQSAETKLNLHRQ